MAAVSESQPTRLDLAIQRRAEELGITLNELATKAGIDRETLRNLRNRTSRPRYRTRAEKAVESVLGWEIGSVRKIEEGREPEPLASDSYERELWANPIFTDDEKRDMVADYRKLKAERSKGL